MRKKVFGSSEEGETEGAAEKEEKGMRGGSRQKKQRWQEDGRGERWERTMKRRWCKGRRGDGSQTEEVRRSERQRRR